MRASCLCRSARASLFRRLETPRSTEPLVPVKAVDEAFALLEPEGPTSSPPSTTRLHVRREKYIASSRERRERRLQRLSTPSSPTELQTTCFGELQDALSEWRELVDIHAGEAQTTSVFGTPAGQIHLNVSTNSSAINAAYNSQLLPSSTTVNLSESTLADAQVLVLAGDIREPESAAVKGAAGRVTPVDGGHAVHDVSGIGATSKIDIDTGTVIEEAPLSLGTGVAYEQVTLKRASLHFKPEFVSRSTANPLRLGGPMRIRNPAAPGTKSYEQLDLAKSKYSHKVADRTPVTPIFVVDATGHRQAVLSADGALCVRRDVIRAALHSALLRSIVPVVHASIAAGVAVVNTRTGDAALILGRRGSGRMTTALHTIAAGAGDLGLVSHGITCVAPSNALAVLQHADDVSSRFRSICGSCSPTWYPAAASTDTTGSILLGLPTHPLVGIGTMLGSEEQLRSLTWMMKAAPPSIDAADIATMRSLSSELGAMESDALWRSAHRVRVDLSAFFRERFPHKHTHEFLQPLFGNWRHTVLLDWNAPSSARHAPVRFRSGTPSDAKTPPFFGGSGCGAHVTQLTAPDMIDAAFKQHAGVRLHRSLRSLPAIGSAVDTTTSPRGSFHVVSGSVNFSVAADLLMKLLLGG